MYDSTASITAYNFFCGLIPTTFNYHLRELSTEHDWDLFMLSKDGKNHFKKAILSK